MKKMSVLLIKWTAVSCALAIAWAVGLYLIVRRRELSVEPTAGDPRE